MAAISQQTDKTRLAQLNLLLFLLIGGLNLFVLLGLPLLMLQPDWVWMLPVLLLVLLTNAHWALVHEAIHGLLWPRPSTNIALGRGMAILFGTQFRMVRYGHLLHHRLARRYIDDDASYDPEKRSALSARLGHYFHLFGGLYLLEVASNLLVFLPRKLLERLAERSLTLSHSELPGQCRITDRQLLSREGLLELRVDGAATLALLAMSFSLYGAYWPVLLAALCGRGLIISMTDSSFHYQPPDDAEQQSMNLYLPSPFNLLVLNFNFHRIHHRYPSQPWVRLPGLNRADADRAEFSWLGGILRQLKGPVAKPGSNPPIRV